MAAGGGGGGGGGGAGLYKLNLSGTPVPIPSPTAFFVPTALPAGEASQYTIQAGDTLSSIAAAFGTTAEILAAYNGLADPSTIFVGQKLLIPVPSPTQADGWQGLLTISILRQPDGSQQTQYGFTHDGIGSFYILKGDLAPLGSYQNRPVRVWGMVDGQQSNGSPVLHVDRYEIPYPDLGFAILQGAETNQTVDGEPITLLTTEDGQSYVVLSPAGMPIGDTVPPNNEDFAVEALIIPGESYGGFPAIRIFSSAMAINPKTGQPVELSITADQPYVQEPASTSEYTPPTATLQRVELVYFTTDPRYQPVDPNAGPVYIQPVWRFTGHYSSGEEFEILVQALKPEFLSPELEPGRSPG
jgi:LysM repeat protein